MEVAPHRSRPPANAANGRICTISANKLKQTPSLAFDYDCSPVCLSASVFQTRKAHWGSTPTHCRAAAAHISKSVLENGAHHPQHQTRAQSTKEVKELADCADESAKENGITEREGGGKAPFLEAVIQSAARKEVDIGHRKGAGAPAQLRGADFDKVFQHDVHGFPWLAHPEGPLEDAEQLAATAFGADRTWFLVNGSTCGVHAAVMATCKPGDCLILPRNCHQSAVSAMVLSGARPKYVLPEYEPRWGIPLGVLPSEVERASNEAREQKQTVGAVLIVSPTYHGVCSDIPKIAAVCHAFGVPLLVDEAHGGHFKFHGAFPDTALESGADIAIQSTHKVLSAFTQAAMLHLKGDLVAAHRVHRSLQLLQTPRPSHLLLSSLDAARLDATRQTSSGVNAPFDSALRLAARARRELDALTGIEVLDLPGLDPLRVAVNTTALGLSGYEADEALVEESGVIAELPWQNGLVFAVGPGSRDEHVNRLVSAFTALAESAPEAGADSKAREADVIREGGVYGEAQLNPREAFFSDSERVPSSAAVGRVCSETLCPYPPGIPVLTPGEVITAAAIDLLASTLQSGGTVTGAGDPSLQTIAVTRVPRGGPEADLAASIPDAEEYEPLDQEKTPLWDAVRAAAERDDAPFYFPGHKKGAGAPAELRATLGGRVFLHDLPEIPGLDNLASPEGPILEAQRLAAAAFGADRTWFLVNGAAGGVQAAVMAACNPGDVLILPETYAQSALPALVLSGAKPAYIPSDAGPDWAPERGIRPEAVGAAFLEAHVRRETVGGVLLASPTGCGVCSDVTSIAHVCQIYGVPLLVDESFGAHFTFHDTLPPSALVSGADVVIHAASQVLPALNQAGMLHLRGNRVVASRLDRALQALQSSSPSYLLLSSLDVARMELAQRNESGNNPSLEAALQLAARARAKLRSLSGITVLDTPDLDLLRFVVDTAGLHLFGCLVDEILQEEFGVLSAGAGIFLNRVVFSVGVGTTDDDVNRLVRAFTLLSAAADGGPPLVRRSDVLKDLGVIEDECLAQLEARGKSWRGRLPALAEPFERDWDQFCGLSWEEQREIGRRVEIGIRDWERLRQGEKGSVGADGRIESRNERGVDRLQSEADGLRTAVDERQKDRANGNQTETEEIITKADGTGTETAEGIRSEEVGTRTEADGAESVTSGQEELLRAELEKLHEEGRNEMRSWVDEASSSLKDNEAVERARLIADFEALRSALTQDFKDPRELLRHAGKALGEIAEGTGRLPDGIELRTLKAVLCHKQVEAAQLLRRWCKGLDPEVQQNERGAERKVQEARAEGSSGRKDCETTEERTESGTESEHPNEGAKDPFLLTDEEWARAQSGGSGQRPSTANVDFATLFNWTETSSSRFKGLQITFHRAKRGYLEAGSLLSEALQLMDHGSGRIVNEGPFTGREKEALSRNELVADALERANEDLVLIRCLGGLPSGRPRESPPKGSARDSLKDALDLEVRKASRVGRAVQEQLQEVQEVLEQALQFEAGADMAEEERKAEERNKCVERHVTSALGHLRRAFGDQVTDWGTERAAAARGRRSGGQTLWDQIVERSLGEVQSATHGMTPRDAFFADMDSCH